MNYGLLLLTLGLLAANGFFVGAEFALIAARRSKIEQMASTGDKRAVTALKAIRELSLMLAGAQLGITMASLGLGAVAEPAIAHIIEGALEGVTDIPATVLHSISFIIALTIVVFFHMVIGEMAPKNIAISRPEQSALVMARPMRVFVVIFRPFLRALNAFANSCLRAIKVEPKDELLAVHTAEEIGVMVSESAKSGLLHAVEHRLLSGAVEFGERDAASVMVPRTEMTAIPLGSSPADIEGVVLESGHTRLPIYSEDMDHILGFVHSKDILSIPEDARNKRIPRRIIRPLLVVPESRKLHPLLLDMRRERRHFALVIDEHGGTAGVVSLEDLLEELVGDILDEYDEGETGIEDIGAGRFLVPGILRLDEAENRIGIELPEGEYETVAGFLMDRLGRIPKRRDEVMHDGWSLRVISMYRRRVEKVLIQKVESTPGPSNR
jgi:CBS domain containing-hemolysin-like protein